MQEEKEREISSNPLGTEPVGALLRKFAIPSIVAMLVSALYNIVDQFFIGQSIGELGNAATNVAFPLSTSCTAISLLLGIGAASAFNLSMGRGEKDKALYYVGNAAVLLFGLGVALCVGTEVFLEPLLVFFGSPENVLGYAKEYVRIVALGFPFLILANGGAHLVRADGSPRYSMMCNLTGAIINTILDPILIFGLGMGMSGAAFATIAGQIVSGLMVVRYLCNYKAGKFTKEHLLPKWKVAGYAMSLGMAQFFNQIAMMVVQIVMNNSLTYYGAKSIYGESIPLACAGIINKVSFLFFAICIGIAQGMQPITSFNYGAKQYDRVKKAVTISLKAGSVVCIIAFILFQLFPRQIIFLLPLLIIFPGFFGIDGIMYAGPVADFMAAVVAAFMLAGELKKM